MKVKWKHIVTRVVPTATVVALVFTSVAHASGVKWA
jgi:hypothetical protein